MSFEDYASKSSVWNYFLRDKNKKDAKCKQCHKVLKTLGGSTSGLRKHLKNVHLVTLTEQHEPQAGPSTRDVSVQPKPNQPVVASAPAKKTKLTDYFESQTEPKCSRNDRVCRMIALDGLPFKLFVTSIDLRQLFEQSGQPLPKSPNTIREILLQEYDIKRDHLRQELQTLKKENRKFSISLDEWSSDRNRRYLNLNLHSQFFSGVFKFRNLGLIRALGSMPANRCKEEISRRLNQYGLILEEDIVGMVTDGCSVMIKLGKTIQCYHQLCLAHAVQLAIVDVFYKNTPMDLEEPAVQDKADIDEDSITFADLQQRRNVEMNNLIATENQEISDDADQAVDINSEDDGAVFLTEVRPIIDSDGTATRFRFHDIISKVRAVAKIFRKSPTKNDEVLQKYVVEEHGKEYALILDCKTRWSSMAEMINRFLKLKSSILKALIDIKSNIVFTDSEIETLKELHDILDILKTVIEALCRRDATLLTAQISIFFALNKFSLMHTTLSTAIANALKNRYKSRRLIETSVLQYLHNPDSYFAAIENEDLLTFPRPTSSEMQDLIENIVRRFVKDHDTAADNIMRASAPSTFDSEILDEDDEPSTSSVTDQLNIELKKSLSSRSCRIDHNDISQCVQVEMVLFENGGVRGRFLSLAYDYLMTLPPTSAESERVFSSAGIICNKLRSSLSDRSVDAISFMRSYYREKKELQSLLP